MNILVKKDNQIFGPHSREEILEFLEDGELSVDDLAAEGGEENWQPLSELLSSEDKKAADSSLYDQFEDDEVDYEKLKEWEDVFMDEDEVVSGKSSSEEVEQETTVTEPTPVATPEIPPSDSSSPPLPAPLEPDISSATLQEESFPQTSADPGQEYVPPPSPSVPLPPPPTAPVAKEVKEKPVSRAGRDRISSSRKIKGLNNKQTVIVVKGDGIIAKIYSTSLVFIILFIVMAILGFAGLLFAPDRTASILKKVGVPVELIESITAPEESR
ncbi:MAG: DUF4339 domain-containing protein [Opitutae bacterium]|nr:DUF4339 domain-containing protein [Opitutae bacterium]